MKYLCCPQSQGEGWLAEYGADDYWDRLRVFVELEALKDFPTIVLRHQQVQQDQIGTFSFE